MKERTGLTMLLLLPVIVSSVHFKGPSTVNVTHPQMVLDTIAGNFSAELAQRKKLAEEEKDRLAEQENKTSPPKALRGSVAATDAQKAQVPHTTFANHDANTTRNKTQQSPTPRVFFLFLTYSGVNRVDLWQSFFAGQPGEQWRIFQHCKVPSICELKATTGGDPLGMTVVPSVHSEYCTDLVSPMVQLLRHAVAESQNPNDKFVFLSETTLPVKPFAEVYNTLAHDANSDFCFYHSEQWARLHSAERGDSAVLLKHSQWVTLSQAHANLMIQRWAQVSEELVAYWSVPMGAAGNVADMASSVSITRSIDQCADEWAVFGTIFGAIVTGGAESVHFPGLNGSPLFVSGWQTQGRDQGSCRTFATWGWSSGFSSLNVAREIMADAPQSMLSCFPTCPSSSPAAIELISDRGLTVMRNSQFLFARKFAAKTVTPDQFNRIILNNVAPVNPATSVTGKAYAILDRGLQGDNVGQGNTSLPGI